MSNQPIKSDPYATAMAEAMNKVFFSDDIFHTMRFGKILAEEYFPATMSFGNSRHFLQSGINQCQRQAEALKKYKDANYNVTSMKEEDRKLLPEGSVYTQNGQVQGPSYEPREVDDFLKKWEKYDLTKEPYSKENLPVILNDLMPYNQNLMWWAGAFDPIMKARFNLTYAENSRTFKGFIHISGQMYEREHEVSVGAHRGRSLRHPFGQKTGEDGDQQ